METRWSKGKYEVKKKKKKKKREGFYTSPTEAQSNTEDKNSSTTS
jgi:hypothetical protein